MKYQYLLIPIAGLLLLSSETSAQSQVSPYLKDEMPQSWQMTQQCYQTLPSDDAWWRTFNDPVLDSLINRAVANNYNVAAAIKRIEMAGKVVKEAQAGYFPTLSASAGWSLDRQSGATVKPAVRTSNTSSFSLGATMNWEIDVFGRVKANVNSRKAAYNVARADYDAVMVSLCANVATAYMQLRTCQEQLAVATAHIDSQERVVKITEARYEADLGDMLDVTQARIVLYGTQSSLPALYAQIRTLMNTLSILLGEYPDSLVLSLQEYTNMPNYKQTVAAGVPSDLLRRRPDIVESEFQLAEYAANIGVAKKDFLPVLSLTGSIGTSAHEIGGMFGDHSLSYSVAPQLSWTIFDGLARNYRTAEAKLQFEAAIDDYNLTVLNAVKEVDNALLNYNSTLEAIELQKKVVNESKKSLDLSVDLYKSGLTAFSNVVDGQMNWLESQNSLVELEGKALSTLISLYQALGGGWQY
ncbi:MAG: TolC family protein [Bacteroides sp.]|nr:TolC family protein [Bacteroides sp.]